MHIDIVNVVWGEAFTRVFAEVSLPTFLAEGNFPYLAKYHDVLYRLYIGGKDLEYLRGTSVRWRYTSGF